MIADKSTLTASSENGSTTTTASTTTTVTSVTLEEVQQNPIEEMYLACRRVLESLHVDPDDDSSPKLFKTVKMDNGQFERIVRNRGNYEYAVDFPAAFIRFVNVYYLTSSQNISDGRATMRIRYILNDLNNSDDIQETHGLQVFKQINVAMQDAKSTEPAFAERCVLEYWDMPQSLDNGLQPYWVDYSVYFTDTSAYQYRDWVDRYLVFPPFADHGDAPELDGEYHINHKSEVSYDDASRLVDSLEDIDDDEESDDDTSS